MFFSYQNIIHQAEKIQQRYHEYIKTHGQPYYSPQKELGWTIAPNTVHRTLNASSDALGFRKTSSIPFESKKLPVISFWGCSIVEGCEVSNEETWLWQLQEKLSEQVTIVNGGVSGYGTDQAFLRFTQRSPDIQPKVAFLGYATTDLLRNLSVQRMLLMQSAEEFLFLKPRFTLENEQLKKLIPPETSFENLVEVLSDPSTQEFLSKHDPFFVRCNSFKQMNHLLLRKLGIHHTLPNLEVLKQEALEIVWRLFQKFSEFCSEKQIEARILFLPIYSGSHPSGGDFDFLMQRLDKNNISYVDLRPVFQERDQYSQEALFQPKNHYSPLSGEWLSRYLAKYIQDHFIQ